MESINTINKRLVELYGADLQGRPNWKIVWSEDEYEKRYGNFPIGNTGIINARKEVREVRKYSYIRNRHILEKRCELPPTIELPERSMEGYSYEAIYVFEDGRGNMLPLRWHPTEIIIQCAIKGPEQVFTSRTEEAEKLKLEQADIRYFESVLENESPYLATMLHNREAVFMDSTKVKKDD